MVVTVMAFLCSGVLKASVSLGSAVLEFAVASTGEESSDVSKVVSGTVWNTSVNIGSPPVLVASVSLSSAVLEFAVASTGTVWNTSVNIGSPPVLVASVSLGSTVLDFVVASTSEESSEASRVVSGTVWNTSVNIGSPVFMVCRMLLWWIFVTLKAREGEFGWK